MYAHECKKISPKGEDLVLQNRMWHCPVSSSLLCKTMKMTWMSFVHDIQFFPPLSDFGKLHLPGTESDLLYCLEQPEQTDSPSTYDRSVLDEAVIIYCLPTVTCSDSTFDMYAGQVFIHYLEKQLQKYQRLDIVCHTYIPDSMKVFIHEDERQRCPYERFR